MPTLAEMRSQKGPQPLPRKTETVTLVEGQHILDETQALADELLSLASQLSGYDENGERTGEPRKQGQGATASARANEIRDQQAAMPARLAEFQGELGLTGFTGGKWQAFKDDHPPREGNRQDMRLTDGKVNSSELFTALGRFVTSWDGEPVAPGDWDSWLAEKICYADRRDLVNVIVRMHEDRMNRIPKSSTSSSTTGTSETA